jgi:DNA-binding transcriptional ArsR family regulator
MPKYRGAANPDPKPDEPGELDDVFAALTDSTRRAVVERLTRGPATTSELAEPFPMSLPSFTQHLGVLERAGLITSSKTGRVRTYELVPDRLGVMDDWLDRQRATWSQRLDQLDSFLVELKKDEMPRSPTQSPTKKEH